MDRSKGVVYTIDSKCVGCNKCMHKCPVEYANVAVLDNGENKISVDPLRCINCGSCVEVCDHEARDYYDDTEVFFQALAKGERVAVVAAPAVRFNFDPQKICGFLKSRGASVVYDVSWGADITTWAYLKAIREKGLKTVVAQPCPAIVSYAQRHCPGLLPWLAPVHSPMSCTAVYLRKYEKRTEKIAFLSPCIGKINEISDPSIRGLLDFNVTFRKLYDYIKANKIQLSSYESADFDDMGCGLGLTFSRPGGLRENVEFHVPGAWVKQVEGVDHAYHYLKQYSNRVKSGRQVPLLVDILNCINGCNLGTATGKNALVDDVDCETNRLKKQVVTEQVKKKRFRKETYALFDYFDKNLRLEDFMRTYMDQSALLQDREPTMREYEDTFALLHKTTEESRKVNCYACGLGSCKSFAKAVINCLR